MLRTSGPTDVAVAGGALRTVFSSHKTRVGGMSSMMDCTSTSPSAIVQEKTQHAHKKLTQRNRRADDSNAQLCRRPIAGSQACLSLHSERSPVLSCVARCGVLAPPALSTTSDGVRPLCRCADGSALDVYGAAMGHGGRYAFAGYNRCIDRASREAAS